MAPPGPRFSARGGSGCRCSGATAPLARGGFGGAVVPGAGRPVAGASAGPWFRVRGGVSAGPWFRVRGGRLPVVRRGGGGSVWCGAPPECLLGSARAALSRPGGLGCALVLRGHSAVSPPHAPASTTPPPKPPALRAPGPAGRAPGTGLVLVEWGRGGVSPQDERATTAHGRDGSRAPSRGDTPARHRDPPAPSPYPARRARPGPAGASAPRATPPPVRRGRGPQASCGLRRNPAGVRVTAGGPTAAPAGCGRR